MAYPAALTGKAMLNEEKLLSQLNHFLGSKPTEDLEKFAFDVSQTSAEFGLRVVRNALQNFSNRCHILLSWLLLYAVVDTFVVLQVYLIKKEFSIFVKCGTSPFESDVLDHLKLPKKRSVNPRFEVKPAFSPIQVDVFEYLCPQPSRNEAPKRRAPEPYEIVSRPAVKAKPDLIAYEAKIRKNLKSSMSVEEAVHRLNSMYRKNSEVSVASTILKAAYDSKLYNRLYGKIVVRLFKGNNRLWNSAWSRVFVSFYTNDCEAVDADRLKVAGTFFGHLLSSNVLDWESSFEIIHLDAEHTTPSKRILLFALFEEMRSSMGAQHVERRLLRLGSSADGLLKAELSGGFWELLKFPALSEHSNGV